MESTTRIKVGDVIIDCYQIYSVFKVSTVVNSKGAEEDLVFYKPYLKTSGLVCSIPFSGFKEAGLRKLMTKEELGEVLTDLSDKSDTNIPIDRNNRTIKDVFYLNEPSKTAKLLKGLWEKSKLQDKSYLKSDQELFDIAVRHLIDEVAIINDDSETTARELVMDAINKN